MRQLSNIRGLIIIAALFLSASWAKAIQHCHDYTVWVVTAQDVNATAPNRLREILTANKYEIAFTTTAATPGADSKLRSGDVVFFGDAHSGVVNTERRIDHFLQNPTQFGRRHEPSELEALPNFYRGWTMVQFANVSHEIGGTEGDFRVEAPRTVFPFRNMKVEVWRKVEPGSSQRGVPMIGGRWAATLIDAKSNFTYEYAWEIRRDQSGGNADRVAWEITRTLLATDDPMAKQLVGSVYKDAYLEFKDGVIEYNRGRTTDEGQWAACNFAGDTFSCEGSQKEPNLLISDQSQTRTHAIKIEGRRLTVENTANAAGGPLATSGDVEVISSLGDVEIAPGGDDSKAHPLRAGDVIRQSDRIVTALDAQAKLRFPDGSIVIVGELTDMKVAVFGDLGQEVRTRIWLQGGKIAAEVNKVNERPSDFSVETGTDAGVRSHHASQTEPGLEVQALPATGLPSRFVVNYDKKSGVTRVSVSQGSVRIKPMHSQSFVLTANQQVAISPGEKVSPITSAAAENNLTGGEAASTSGNFTRRDNMTISPPAKTLRYFGSPSEDACKTSCAGDQRCVAYTFVRPGGYQTGDPPMCYLMSSLGPEVPNSCCVSGFKDGATARPSSPLVASDAGGAGIAGQWVTPTGDVITLSQNGSRVTGTYRGALGNGVIAGTFDGRTLSGTLEIEQFGIRVSQRLTLRLMDGRLEGTIATPLSTINITLSRPTN